MRTLYKPKVSSISTFYALLILLNLVLMGGGGLILSSFVKIIFTAKLDIFRDVQGNGLGDTKSADRKSSYILPCQNK